MTQRRDRVFDTDRAGWKHIAGNQSVVFQTLQRVGKRLVSGRRVLLVEDDAVVDLNLNGRMSTPVLDLLLAGEVPVILCTGYDVSAIDPQFPDLPRLEKPFTRAKLRRLIATSILAEPP